MAEAKLSIHIPEVYEYNKTVAQRFSEKLRQLPSGAKTDEKLNMNVPFLGVEKDIIHDHIYDPPFQTKEQFKANYERKEAERKRKKKQAYGFNVRDSDFACHEMNLLGDIYHKNAPFYKENDAVFKGYKGVRRAFSQFDKNTIQESNVFERGLEPFKQLHRNDCIKGRNLSDKDFEEEKHENEPYYRNIKIQGKADKQKHGVPFEKVVEYNVRQNLSLMFGKGKNVDKPVAKAIENYNRSINVGSISNAHGRYRGGFQRRQFIDLATVENNKLDDYEFSIDPDKKLDLNAYYFDYGNSDKPDGVADKGIIEKPVDITEATPIEQNINLKANPITF